MRAAKPQTELQDGDAPQDGDTDLVPDQTSDLAGSSDDDALKQLLALAVPSPRTATGTVVRKFVNTIDKAVPLDGVGLDRRREVITAALEMTQRLVHTPYDLGRGFVQSSVLVNVNVDVNIASREPTTRSNREESCQPQRIAVGRQA